MALSILKVLGMGTGGYGLITGVLGAARRLVADAPTDNNSP
jgi:hypothetical protein